jgi:hypothetical protein
MFDHADVVHRYTRADALRDGVLIDVSAVAREAGTRYPVALTRAVWQRCVAVPPGVLCQDEACRLWDVVYLLACAIRRSCSGPEVRFGVHVRNDNRDRLPPLVRLKAACGPGDFEEPVVTIMTQDQDWLEIPSG